MENKILYNKVKEGAYRDLAKSWKIISKDTLTIYKKIINEYNKNKT